MPASSAKAHGRWLFPDETPGTKCPELEMAICVFIYTGQIILRVAQWGLLAFFVAKIITF